MEYVFKLADAEETEAVFELIAGRVSWMDENGIHQWNDTEYLDVYPLSYYQEHQQNGRLYVLKQDDRIISAAVLLETDERWPDDNESNTYYVHNFASERTLRGIGSIMLEAIEKHAAENGKTSIRLDCAVDNPFLNHYYETRGYRCVGTCVDGPYIGNRMLKIL